MAQSIFSKIHPGSLVAYREDETDGLRFGRFASYNCTTRRMMIQTIPAYGREAQNIFLREDLVAEAAEIPGQNPVPVHHEPAVAAEPKAKRVKAVAVMTDRAPEQIAAEKPANWRVLAAQKAWVTMRAKKAAAGAMVPATA